MPWPIFWPMLYFENEGDKSYTGTLRKQGRDVWSGLTKAMKGFPFLPSDA